MKTLTYINPSPLRNQRQWREMEEGEIKHRTVMANGIRMHVAEKGEGPVVLLLHGFPELWYSWRHQIHGLAALGYHAVAPDFRGYGDTEAPPNPSSYSIFHIVADLISLIDSLSQDQVIHSSIPISSSIYAYKFFASIARFSLWGMIGERWWRGICAR